MRNKKCTPGYHHVGFLATYTVRHMTYGCKLLIPVNSRVLNKLSKEDNICDPK